MIYNDNQNCSDTCVSEPLKIEKSIGDKLVEIEINLDSIYNTLNSLDNVINGNKDLSEEIPEKLPIGMIDHLNKLLHKSGYLVELINRIRNQF